MSPQHAAEVRDLILQPPAADPYVKLKEELIKCTLLLSSDVFNYYFSSEDLGDRKPSQLLRHIEQLLGDKATTADRSFLRQLFLQRLPPNVRMVLASTKDDKDLESLASLADKVVEVAAPTVSTVQTSETTQSQLSKELEQLCGEVVHLQKLVTSLSATKHPSPPTRPSDLCWYHARFAEKSAKCIQPCSWPQENL